MFLCRIEGNDGLFSRLHLAEKKSNQEIKWLWLGFKNEKVGEK